MNYGTLMQLNTVGHDVYKDDSVQFNLLNLMLEEIPYKLYSDNSHIIICQSSPDTPVWIWTDNTITQDNAHILYECIYNEFEITPYITFIVKPVISGIIKRIIRNASENDSRIKTNMSVYCCPNPVKPSFVDGRMQQAILTDIDVIAEYRAKDLKEMNNLNTSKEEQWDNSLSLIRSNNLYIWKNNQENITSIAFIAHRSKEQARINRVYTEPKYRNKGYAAMLMYELSALILQDGILPMVYTDSTYPASNKAYKKVGFTKYGNLLQIGLIGNPK